MTRIVTRDEFDMGADAERLDLAVCALLGIVCRDAKPETQCAQRVEDRRRLADRRERLERLDRRKQIDLAFERLKVAASERLRPKPSIIGGRAGHNRRRHPEALVFDGEVQRIRLRPDPSGVAACEREDHRMNGRPPRPVKVDEGPVLVEQDADKGSRRGSLQAGLRDSLRPIFVR